MSDIREKKDLADKEERRSNRSEGEGNAWVQSEADRLRALPEGHGASPEAELRRQERLKESDPLSRFPSYDVRQRLEPESQEIRLNPEGYLRRHQGEGFDAATERELRQSLLESDQRRGVAGRRL